MAGAPLGNARGRRIEPRKGHPGPAGTQTRGSMAQTDSGSRPRTGPQRTRGVARAALYNGLATLAASCLGPRGFTQSVRAAPFGSSSLGTHRNNEATFAGYLCAILMREPGHFAAALRIGCSTLAVDHC